MDDACTNVKRVELREIGSNAKTKMCFEVRALALHPRLHHRVGFPIHYLPQREPLSKRFCYNTRSTKLLSQTTTSQPRGRPVANTTTNTSTEEGFKHQLHLSLEGAKQPTQPLPKREQTNHPINLYQRGIQQIQGCLQLRGLTSNTSLFLSSTKTKILID